MPPLDNTKHEIFAQKVAQGKTLGQAYALAGYAESDSNAGNLARSPTVAGRIAEIKGISAARAQVSADRVLAELARIGFADITQAVTIERGKVLVSDTNDIPPDIRAAMSEISQGRDGIKIKMHDKRAALESLGKHLGLWKDAGDVNLTVSLVDLVNGSYKLEAGELTATDGKVIEAQPNPPDQERSEAQRTDSGENE